MAVRDVDKVARLGGDEFAVLSIECDHAGSNAVHQRVVEALDAAGIPASSGMAMDDGSGLGAAVAEADRYMYEVKAMRRRRRAS